MDNKFNVGSEGVVTKMTVWLLGVKVDCERQDNFLAADLSWSGRPTIRKVRLGLTRRPSEG
jgi:hypothetical protein